ncbi:hypothetical protein BDV97DRAFT_399492 [Delphinella strobiligena]|nr:hypothetical protein BDV97DRAFT_399492 [Delphinella strobiligena]
MLTTRDATPKSVICGVCCVAAVGVLFMGKLSETKKSAHRMARILLDDVIEESPLEAAKCCALLALYNVMSKATVALAYLEIGIDLVQRDNSTALHCPDSSQRELLDRKKAWRTLIFLACWTSSTLGYVSSSDWMSPNDSFRDVEIGGETEIENIVETEMVKLAMLKHAILRMDVTSKHQTSLEIVRQDLHQWHQDLPAAMRLTNLLNNPDLKTGVRTSIYIVHLLYLVSLMLLYRQLLNTSPPPIDQGSHGLFYQIHTDAVTAAQQSSRILNLLRADNCVVQRCWISIYQSYCATLLILHGIAQKLMQPISQDCYAEDLDQARRCLEVLDFCGEVDAVAAKFCNLLRPFYKALNSMAVSRASLATSPDPRLQSLCAELFSLVRRPFGDFHPQGVLSNGNGSPDDPFCPAVMANPLAPAGTVAFGWQMLTGADNYGNGSGSGSGSSSTLLGNLGPAKFLDGVPHGWLDDAETRASAMEF